MAKDVKEIVTSVVNGNTAELRETRKNDKISGYVKKDYESARKNVESKKKILNDPEKSEVSVDLPDKSDRRAANSRNNYAAKKTVAQGMMDVALITANANQLRYLIEYQRKSSTFYVNVVLIICSLLLQIAVGVSLIFKGKFDIRGESKSPGARRIDNYVVVGVFLTTIINVFVAAFSISPPSSLTSVVIATNHT